MNFYLTTTFLVGAYRLYSKSLSVVSLRPLHTSATIATTSPNTSRPPTLILSQRHHHANHPCHSQAPRQTILAFISPAGNNHLSIPFHFLCCEIGPSARQPGDTQSQYLPPRSGHTDCSSNYLGRLVHTSVHQAEHLHKSRHHHRGAWKSPFGKR